MNVTLSVDIIENNVLIIKAGEMVKVDATNGIAYHEATDFYFDIKLKEYSYLN